VFDWFTLHIAALVVTAAIFGAMLFFMAFFTPMVFRHLEREAAGAFMSKVFPTYYGVMGPVSALPALLLFPYHSYGFELAVMLVVAGAFVIGSRVFTPALDRHRDDTDRRRFNLLHRLSILTHLAQFVAVTVVLVRLAQ
jgi:predicted permease